MGPCDRPAPPLGGAGELPCLPDGGLSRTPFVRTPPLVTLTTLTKQLTLLPEVGAEFKASSRRSLKMSRVLLFSFFLTGQLLYSIVFLLYHKVNQLYVYIYSLTSKPPSPTPPPK